MLVKKRKRRSKYVPSNKTLGISIAILASFLTGRWTYQSGLLEFGQTNVNPGRAVSEEYLSRSSLETGNLRELLSGDWVVRGVENSQTLLVGDTFKFSDDSLKITRPNRPDRNIKFDVNSATVPNRMYWLELSDEAYTGQDVLYTLFKDDLLLTIPFDGKRPPHHGANRNAKTEMVLLGRRPPLI